MKSGANYSESQKIAVADQHPKLWGCHSFAMTTAASNARNCCAWADMGREPLPIKIDMRVLPRGLGGPRVESTVVVF
jgi:hypothetical protein